MTVGEAIRHLVLQIQPLGVDGVWPEIADIDFAATDDGWASVHVHFKDEQINGGLPAHASFDLKEVFLEEIERALFAGSALDRSLHALRKHDRVVRLTERKS